MAWAAGFQGLGLGELEFVMWYCSLAEPLNLLYVIRVYFILFCFSFYFSIFVYRFRLPSGQACEWAGGRAAGIWICDSHRG